MIADFAGCWLVEVGCKYLFAELEPKPLITRGRERREQRRALELAALKEKEMAEANGVNGVNGNEKKTQ